MPSPLENVVAGLLDRLRDEIPLLHKILDSVPLGQQFNGGVPNLGVSRETVGKPSHFQLRRKARKQEICVRMAEHVGIWHIKRLGITHAGMRTLIQ
jgi:hypothetical protein